MFWFVSPNLTNRACKLMVFQQVKARVSSANPDLSLVCSYDGEYDDVGFTVTVYSSSSAAWVEETVKRPYAKTVSVFFFITISYSRSHSSCAITGQWCFHLEDSRRQPFTPIIHGQPTISFTHCWLGQSSTSQSRKEAPNAAQSPRRSQDTI